MDASREDPGTPGSAGLITRHLFEWKAGDPSALTRLAEQVYPELRRLAGAILSRRFQDESIQPTELVHSLYLQLPRRQEFDWQSRAHFFNVAAKMMRSILVDHARVRRAVKRGGGAFESSEGIDVALQTAPADLLDLHLALERFAAEYPRQAEVVELRMFGGLTVEEIADVLRLKGFDCSVRTVERDWRFAKAWLQNVL